MNNKLHFHTIKDKLSILSNYTMFALRFTHLTQLRSLATSKLITYTEDIHSRNCRRTLQIWPCAPCSPHPEGSCTFGSGEEHLPVPRQKWDGRLESSSVWHTHKPDESHWAKGIVNKVWFGFVRAGLNMGLTCRLLRSTLCVYKKNRDVIGGNPGEKESV